MRFHCLRTVSVHRCPIFVQARLTAIAPSMRADVTVRRWGVCDRLRGCSTTVNGDCYQRDIIMQGDASPEFINGCGYALQ